MLLVSDQRSPEWFAARQGRITASLAAACLGEHPHMSPRAAWKAVMGLDKRKENADMRWGVEREAEAVSAYELERGLLVWPAGFFVHDEHDWLGASPDGLVEDDGLLEAKCPRNLPDGIPHHHRIQMLVQLACTGRAWADYIAWVPPMESIWRVEADPSEIGELIRRLQEFHQQYIATNMEPPIRRGKNV